MHLQLVSCINMQFCLLIFNLFQVSRELCICSCNFSFFLLTFILFLAADLSDERSFEKGRFFAQLTVLKSLEYDMSLCLYKSEL